MFDWIKKNWQFITAAFVTVVGTTLVVWLFFPRNPAVVEKKKLEKMNRELLEEIKKEEKIQKELLAENVMPTADLLTIQKGSYKKQIAAYEQIESNYKTALDNLETRFKKNKKKTFFAFICGVFAGALALKIIIGLLN